MRLVASPFFTAFAVLSLAAGVAVTTAVYSVVDSLMFRGFEVRDSDRVAFLMVPGNGVMRHATLSSDDVTAIRRAQRSFEHLSGATAVWAQVASTRNTESMSV